MSNITLKGIVKRVIFTGDSGYTIVSVKFEDALEEEAIVGYMKLLVDCEYVFTGEYIQHPKYGEQFKVTKYEMVTQGDENEVINFLSSAHFNGIGKRTAAKIFREFGEETMQVIKLYPEKLLEIGISDIIVEELTTKLSMLSGMESYFELLSPVNISEYLITEIYKYMNSEKIPNPLITIKNNPYQMLGKILGFTFQSADAIYLYYHDDYENENRIQSAILYYADKYCEDSGDTIFENEEIIHRVCKNLSLSVEKVNIAFNDLLNSGEIKHIPTIEKYAIKIYYETEHSIARNLKMREIFNKHDADESYINKQIQVMEIKEKIQYSEIQKNAISLALKSNLSVITGGPGTGKTTIIKAIANIYEKMHSTSEDSVVDKFNKIILCAPTGRAVQRMFEATSYPAKTIHSLLEWDPHTKKFNKNVEDMLHYELVIIDEFSMVDIFLANSLFKAIRPDAKIIIVGDSAQLESVNPGNVLANLIDSNVLDVIQLKTIYRQGDGSKIAQLANDIDDNQKIELVNTHDMSVITKYNNLVNVVKMIVDRSYEAGYNESEVQVLYPKYKGKSGINELNKVLRPPLKGLVYEYNDVQYAVGDKVMQLKNNYDKDIYNGDIGFVNSIVDRNAKHNQAAITVNFKSKIVQLTRNELIDLTHAYAISVHKSQGSEFKVVVLPINSEAGFMLTKKLIYTAITRAKDKLIIVGDMEYFYNGIEEKDRVRQTLLQSILQRQSNDLLTEQTKNETVPELSPYDFLN